MTTDHLGPLVAGRDEDKRTVRVAPPRAAAELQQSFLLNLGYFWIGRFGGAVPYFPGVVAAGILFVLFGPRERHGWLAVLALVVSWLGYILLIPDNWYGGGGAIGNRYFVNLVPLGLVLLPRGRGAWVAAGAAVVGGTLLAPILASPIHHSLRPGEHATGAAFRLLPAGDDHARRPVGVHRRLAQAPALQRARRRPRPPAAGGPSVVFPVVPRRRHVRTGVVLRRGGFLAPRRRERGRRAAGSRAPVPRPPRRHRRAGGGHRDGTARPARGDASSSPR